LPFKNIKDVTKAKDTSSILVIGKGVLFSFLISAVLLVIYGILLTVTSLSETSVPTVIMIITMISIALSSIYTAVRVDSRGWLNGAIVGFVYMLVLFLIGLIFNTGVTLDSFIFFRLLMGFVIGALAGIIGINIK
jgi:putative membrane protein (TIGR04086 family)